jgi:hypothetical protein
VTLQRDRQDYVSHMVAKSPGEGKARCDLIRHLRRYRQGRRCDAVSVVDRRYTERRHSRNQTKRRAGSLFVAHPPRGRLPIRVR